MKIQDIKKYINKNDWRVKENSNTSFSYAGLQGYIAGADIANYTLKELYTPEIAEAHQDCFIHLHDLSNGIMPYCAGWSLMDLIKEGFNCDTRFIYSKPAKHFPAILGQMENFLFTLSQEWAGAMAFSSVDTLLAPFIKIDGLTYKQVEQEFQQHIFNLNNKYRIAFQTPFSNYSFDLKPPPDLINEFVIIGGVEQDFTYGDCQKEMDIINKAFMEVLSCGDGMGKPFGFPIPTYSITKDFNWDNVLAQKLFEMAGRNGTPYFSNFINSDLNPSDVRSMCPLDNNEEIIYYSDYHQQFKKSTIGTLYNSNKKENNYLLLQNGKLVQSKINRIPCTSFAEIVLVNGLKIKTSINHLNLTKRGTIATENLTTDDYLPISKSILKGKGLSKEEGILVGAFLGDGSYQDENTIVFSLNHDKKQELGDWIEEYCINNYGAKISKSDCISQISGLKKCYNLYVISPYLKGLILEFVINKGALDKHINMKALNMSYDFREGIIEGLYRTDGGNNNRIYTASKKLANDIITILASMGIPSNLSSDTRLKETGKLSDNEVYCIRYYSSNYNKSRENIFIQEENYYWFKIKEINYYKKNKGSYAYCFEVTDSNEPYFMMPNGIITHNCRLRLDIRELVRNSSGLFASGDKTGSVGVTTINTARIGYLNKNNVEEFYKMYDHYLVLAKDSLLLKRKEVLKNMNNGLMPYTKRYLGSLENHFNTIGIIGVNECLLNMFGYGIETTEGKNFSLDLLDYTLERLQDFQEETGLLFNLEATPAEGVTHRFAKHDLEDFPDIITANGKGYKYYTNSTMLPVEHTENLWEAFNHQDELQIKYTSGTVFHIFLNEPIYNWRVTRSIIKKAFTNYRLPYVSITPNIAVCPIHGRLENTSEFCPYSHTPEEIEIARSRGGEIVEFYSED